jgi:hypothetical protein
MYEHHSRPLLSNAQFLWRLAGHFGWVALLLGGSLAMGMTGYMTLAHMSAVDAFLNSAMLLGGMGPVGELPNDTAKIFSGCFALYAGIVFIASAGLLIAPVAHRVLHKLHLSQ